METKETFIHERMSEMANKDYELLLEKSTKAM